MPKNNTVTIGLAYLILLFTSCADTKGKKQTVKEFSEIQIALPKNTISATYDIGNNYWCLIQNDETMVMVRPASSEVWQKELMLGLKQDLWHTILADEHGLVWLASSNNLMFLDAHKTAQGWMKFITKNEFPKGHIIALKIGPNGNPIVELSAKSHVEVDVLKLQDGADTIYKTSFSVYENNKNWKAHWEVVARMPGSNHDLRGDVQNGKFYMAGGLTAQYGYPMKSHAYSELFEFDSKTQKWRIVADLGYQRIYCATGALEEELWVMGGDILEENRERYTTRMSQSVNPKTGLVKNTVPLNHDLGAPIAFNLKNRLYVMGFSYSDNLSETPLVIESIGEGEKKWRQEPNGPLGKGAIYGATYKDKICILVANRQVVTFDVVTQKWESIVIPRKVRSAQVACYNDEVWVMGGRDQENQAAVQVYNFKNKQWSDGPDLPRELAWGTGFTIDGQLYITGGAAGRAYSNRTFRLKTSRH